MKFVASLLILLAFTQAASAAPTYQVAPPPLGDDAHDGSASAPFATLERARQAVRAHLATQDLREDLVVEVRGGTYELAAPLRFESADSGKNGFAVVYRATPGETPLLSGGRRVGGWTREPDGVYRADVDRTADFRQLWVNDRRAIRARTPNLGGSFKLAAEKQADGFDLPREPLAAVPLRPNEVEISVLIAWMHKRLRIEKLSTAGDGPTARAVINPVEWDAVLNQPQGDRVYLGRSYWLENARAFLDAPGEFFLDRHDGVLRYRPRDDEDPATASFVRPELESIIVLAGRPDAAVHDLRFEGLTFAHTGWTRPNRVGFVDVQANSLVPAKPAEAVDPQYRHNQRKDRIPAAFQAETADRIVIRHCRFTRLGGAGVVFTHGGDDNLIESNSFFDLSAGGIEIGEDAARPVDARLFPRRNVIANNFVAHIGEDYYGSVAILGYYTDQLVIRHNEIVGVPYTGISQGWGWGKPTGPDDARANRITHNFVANFMRRLDDGGGIYATDRQLDSEIAHNFVTGMLPPDAHTEAGGALYPDQFTEGFHLHHNVVTDALRWLFLWNPNIRGNRIDANYADTTAHRNDGPDNHVEPVQLISDGRWPADAQAIRAAAGLEPAFAGVREIDAPTDVIVESTSVDFQIRSGAWTPTDAPAGRYGSFCKQAVGPASARWLPILPRTGIYEVSVWRPAGSEAAHYTVQHAAGETSVTVAAGAIDGGRWESLGRFNFQAGASGSVTLTETAEGKRTLADSVRFKWQRP